MVRQMRGGEDARVCEVVDWSVGSSGAYFYNLFFCSLWSNHPLVRMYLPPIVSGTLFAQMLCLSALCRVTGWARMLVLPSRIKRAYTGRASHVCALLLRSLRATVFSLMSFKCGVSSVCAASHGRSQRTRWVSMWGLVLAKKPSLRNALHRFSSLCALCACISRGASWGASCQGVRVRFSYSPNGRFHPRTTERRTHRMVKL